MGYTKNLAAMLHYGVKLKLINLWMLFINIAILGYTVFSTCTDNDNLWENELFTIILFFLLNIVWQIVSTLSEIVLYVKPSGHWIKKRQNIKMFVLDSEVENTYTHPADIPEDIPVIIDEKVNSILLSDTPIQIKLLKSHSLKVWNYITQNKGILHLFLKAKWDTLKKGAFFNESKLCQASEIFQSNECSYVRIGKGCYYNSFLTNDIYTHTLLDQEGTTIHAPLNASTYPIKKLDDSVFSNHIGVTTLAISSDNYVMLLRHNNNAAISANMLAGSGSGSVDYYDWKASSDADLREILIRAAHRELFEEAGFKELEKQNVKFESKVIGAYRNLERGGKPDYCLVTRIDADHFTLQDVFKAEKKEVVNVAFFIPITDKDGNYDLSKLTEHLSNKRNSVSISLYMNYYFLKNTLEKE